jgi:hypothetical protein
MDIDQRQKRLKENFRVNGVVGGGLRQIFAQEEACSEHFIKTFPRRCVVANSFQGFFLETVQKSREWVTVHGWPVEAPNYQPVLFYYVFTFRRFRECENLLLKGYPFEGLALLRDLKDQAILICAMAHNITTFPRLFGCAEDDVLKNKEQKSSQRERETGQEKVPEYLIRFRKDRKNRKKEERCIKERILGKNSGFPEDILVELSLWEDLFNEAVHGSRQSFVVENDLWSRGFPPASIGPIPSDSAFLWYGLRASEVAWLLTRLLPFLEPSQDSFGPDWHRRYSILDDEFRYELNEFVRAGKKIGEAFIALVDEKFSFKQPFHYFEADGSG